MLTVALGALGALFAWLTVWKHRRSVPVITAQSSAADVLKAAVRSSKNPERKRYKTADNRYGLLVHGDGNALVLTPPIVFESGGEILHAWDNTSDPDRLVKVVGLLTPEFGSFEPGADDIDAPMSVDAAVEAGHGEILTYTG